MTKPQPLAGLSAVVTGSARGIGRAIALELAAGGAGCLIHTGHDERAAQGVADEMRELGAPTDVVVVDLTEPEGPETLIRRAWHWQGQIDLWVNNAGADVLTGEAASWPFERKLESLWQVDVLAAIRLARLAGQRMKARGHGAIVNIGWDQAELGMAGDSGELFAASKGAIMAFTRSLAQSLAPEVRVNCVAPGWIKTAWGEQASAYWQDRAISDSLLGRWGTPEDVARAVRFLCSPDGAFLTGQILNVNGGWKRA